MTLQMFNRKVPIFINQKTSQKIYWNLFEKKETLFFKENLKSDDVCLDIGANVGYYTALFASKASKVIAIDPVPHNAALLRLATKMNRDNHIEIIEAAISDNCSSEVFLEHEQASLSSLLGESNNNRSPAHKYTVNVMTIDSLYIDKLDIIKIDIEGAEFNALTGMKETINKTKPRILMIELVNEHLNKFGSNIKEVVALMEDIGYRPMKLGLNQRLEEIKYERPRNDNYFFIPK